MNSNNPLYDEMNWIWCPVCQRKSRIKVRDNTILINFPLYCPKCKKETLISVHKKIVRIIKEPDAKGAEPMNKE